MVDGYRTPEQARRDAAGEQRQRDEQAIRAVQDALPALQAALDKLRTSGVPPDCVIEFHKQGRRGLKVKVGGPAWYLGNTSTGGSRYDDPPYDSWALTVDGRLFRGSSQPERKAFIARLEQTPDNVYHCKDLTEHALRLSQGSNPRRSLRDPQRHP